MRSSRQGTKRSATLLASLALLGAMPAGHAGQEVGPDEGGERSTFFALPLARDARTLAERAEGHIEALRYAHALEDLQQLIEDHGGEVLPPAFRAGSDTPTRHPVHIGAGEWAEERMRTLPVEARALYRERFEAAAGRALHYARERGDRLALGKVARTWPLTASAHEAWWTLGDIELERGHTEEARAAYERAAIEPEHADRLAARLELVDAVGTGSPETGADTAGRMPPQLALAGPGQGGGPLPSADGDRWHLSRDDVDLFPLTARELSGHHPSFPILAGETLIVSTSRRVYAFDAWTGRAIWDTGEPRGWEDQGATQRKEYLEAIDEKKLLVAPAVENDIVVASLQVPVSLLQGVTYNNIDITKRIPERRLFAYDLATGEPLWSHTPDVAWDGESDSYAHQMSVAAPPTISGSRVIVPCYRMQGRIAMHAACYELETGELLWSTSLISGQRETNMFGRQEKEFCGVPAVVAGDRVIVQTQLGAVAALDLFTGRILWESLYDQIPLEPTRQWNAPERDEVWTKPSPPVVVADEQGGVVVSAPSDGKALLGLDLVTGAVLWEHSVGSLRPMGSDRRHGTLLGADVDTVFLGGPVVSAFQKPGGLRSTPAPTPRWSHPAPSHRSNRPRAVLGAEEVLLLSSGQREVVDRRRGKMKVQKCATWDSDDNGNASIAEGMLFTVGRGGITGIFDWDVLLERQRRRLLTRPDDREELVDLGELLMRRAGALRVAGETGRSLAHSQEGISLVRPLQDASGVDSDPRLRSVLHQLLRVRALSLADQADTPGAIEALREARELAPDRLALRDTLFSEERLLRGRGRATWRNVLAELELHCADLEMTDEALGEELEWLLGDALIDPDSLGDLGRRQPPVGLWVLLVRAHESATFGATEAALGDLHDALAVYGDLSLAPGIDVFDVVSARITRRLDISGRAPYERFEREADALYDRAIETTDEDVLRRLARLYPHSRAARRSLDVRLTWSFDAGDARQAAQILYGEAASVPRPAAESARVFLRLAETLAGAGNERFLETALYALALDAPELVLDVAPYAGRNLGEVAGSLHRPPTPAPPLRFDESIRQTRFLDGRYQVLGRVDPEPRQEDTQQPSRLVFLFRNGGSNRIEAFSSDRPGLVLWRREFDRRLSHDNAALSDERVLVALERSVEALDVDTGNDVWSWRPDGEVPQHVTTVAVHGGVAVVQLSDERGTGRQLQALDANSGVELWSLPLNNTMIWRGPIFGDGLAVLFGHASPPHRTEALVVDLVRGTVRTQIELLPPLESHNSADTTWIEDGRLVTPIYSARRQPIRLAAYDLETGESVWRLPLADGETLHALAAYGGKTYLIAPSTSTDARTGSLYVLDVALGGLRKIAQLKPDDQVLGLGSRSSQRRELSSPYLYICSPGPGGRKTQLKAVHLPYQRRWTYSLPVSEEALYDQGMPLPVTTEECVVFLYSTKNERSSLPRQGHLEFVDQSLGQRRDSRLLESRLEATNRRVEIHGFGDALYVLGNQGMAILEMP
jgi:outer membrane protein assembly factor BamB